MRRLINVTKGVIEAHAILFWYGILEKDLKRRVLNKGKKNVGGVVG
jgi:hypothetical protein